MSGSKFYRSLLGSAKKLLVLMASISFITCVSAHIRCGLECIFTKSVFEP